MDSILALFCAVDDFWQQFAPQWQLTRVATKDKHRHRLGQMHPSEIMTILIAFHHSHYRTFKAYYLDHVQAHWRAEFPTLLSYTRFVDLIPSVLVPLHVYLQTRLGTCTGVSFVDSTPLAVCKNPRISRHRVFAAQAARGKTSTGWFFGFKLHLVITHQGEILNWRLTAGNVDDRTPVPSLTRDMVGVLVGDKGYLSQPLQDALAAEGIRLLTKRRKNMAQVVLTEDEAWLVRHRALIEAVNGLLKATCQIEHARHRSPTNFLVHLISGLVAYCHLPQKPCLPIVCQPTLAA